MTNWRQQTTLVRGGSGGARGRRVVVAAIALGGLIVSSDSAVAGTVVRFNTSLGAINVEMLDSFTPITVQNFLTYVNAGDYTNTFIHRSARKALPVPPNPPGSTEPFVIQGGGYSASNFNQMPNVPHIPQRPMIQNEFHESNLRGTIAMAKLGGNPNSATSEWFFNMTNNSFLDSPDSGSFTVFGQVLGADMTIVDAIAALPRHNFSSQSAFNEVPLRNYTSGTPVAANLVVLNSVIVVPPWQNPLDKLDASHNGNVAPQDVLILVNDLNANGIRDIPGPYTGPNYIDVDGNGRIEPADVLNVVNYLNALPPGGASGLSGEVPAMAAVPEPSGLALALAAVGGALVLAWRRRRFATATREN